MNKYLRHIKQLCRKYKITLLTGKTYRPGDINTSIVTDIENSQGWSIQAKRIVAIPRITNAKHYATALHEIGHILYNLTNAAVNKMLWSFYNKKITQFIIEFEHEVSTIGFKLCKFKDKHTLRALWAVGEENQTGYIQLYEQNWNTVYYNPKYMWVKIQSILTES